MSVTTETEKDKDQSGCNPVEKVVKWGLRSHEFKPYKPWRYLVIGKLVV